MTKLFTPNPLKSIDTANISHELSNQQIAIIRKNEDLGGEVIADRLGKLRNAVWGNEKTKKLASDEQQKQMFDEATNGLNEKQTEQLISSYARMGNLYEIAALSARANYLENIRNTTNDVPPGGVEEFVKKNSAKTTAELVEQLSQPVFEVIMTAHPTNVNSLESIKAQRNVALALEKGSNEDLKVAIEEYQKTPISPNDENGKPKNLTVRDETKNMLYTLSIIYEDLPKVYARYDETLHKHATQSNNKYDPRTLQLQTKLGAWGSSGDKDGNKNVSSETTLEAIALHTKTALEHYKKDLENIPALSEFKTDFESRLNTLNPLLEQIGQLRQDARDTADGKKSITAQELNTTFDNLSKQLVEIRGGLDSKKFEGAITENAKNNKDALNLLHRFRTFGFSFGKIEYRETAEEYNRVVESLLPDLRGITPQGRAEKLTTILMDKNKSPADFMKAHEADIIANGAGKKYDSENAMPIAYHTLKRMQLARDFGDVIKDNVLAECGKLEFPEDKTRKPTPEETTNQGVANLLEAQFLQRAVEKDGKRATLGIIPLFEEASTMKNVDKIMGSAYKNDAYKQQMKLLQGDANKPTQEVMIAHSDNSRRSGSMAARAYIYEAHKKLRALGDAEGIKTHFYEGGSVTDAYRNGVRALSANINAFMSHDFAKFTFQGSDLLAYFNHPASTERIFDRSIAHQAGFLSKQDAEWRVARNGTTNEIMDNIAIEAMKRTYDDYVEKDFHNDKMGALLKKLDYDGYVDAANISSRAKGRVAFAAGSTTQMGAQHVNIETARTIGYSMSQQVAAIFPTFAGAENLEKYLIEETQSKYKELEKKPLSERTKNETEFLDKLKIEDEKLSPAQLQFIYKKSPTFHNGQDLAGTAYIFTDIDATDKIIRSHLRHHGDSEEVINAKMESDLYWQRIKNTYKQVAELAYKSITGKQLSTSNYDNSQIIDKMKEIFPHSNKAAEEKLGYRKFLLDYRQKNPQFYDENELAGDSAKLSTARDLASAFQAVSGGRWLDFSDPTIARHKAKNNGISI